MTRRGVLILVLAVAVVSTLGALFAQRVYLRPAGVLDTKIESLRADILEMEESLDRHPGVRAELRTVSATMLPGEIDQAEHLLRTELTELCESAGLTVLKVDSQSPRAAANPISKSRATSDALKKAIAKRTDFLTMTGTVQARGGLSQALGAMALVRAQPWAHQFRSFSLRPQGEAGDDYELRFEVTTAFSPELTAGRASPPERVAMESVADSSWRPIVDHNVFRLPPPPAPPPVVVEKPAPSHPTPVRPPDAPPYKDWRITSIVSVGSMAGQEARTEVMLLNVKNQQRRTLTPGEKVLGASLVEASGEVAVFEIDGVRSRVRLGSTLDVREPISQVDRRP